MKYVEAYGWDLKRTAFLENAYDISYHCYATKLWTASFTLPYNDKKREFVKPFAYIKIWDVNGAGQDYPVGLFRILPMVESDIFSADSSVTYECEHVISTLLDDVMIGFHEVGNKGVYTNKSIGYILENQSNKRWALGECDFKREFLYGWENENLLSALFSIPKPFGEGDYYWTFNTDKLPWTLNLKQVSKVAKTDVRYRKNISGMTRTVDPRNLATRLYCYGSGEDDNVLNIASLNNNKEYLESPNVATYGVITQIWNDERFTNQESLLEAGKALLKKLEVPETTYEFDLMTLPSADIRVGDLVRVVEAKTIDVKMVVREYEKSDVSGEPLSGKIVLGNGTEDLGDSVAGLIERQRISETYSQGAESLFMDSYSDNADKENPAEINFIIPQGVVHVNDMIINIKMAPFRVHFKAVGQNAILTNTSSYAGGVKLTTPNGGGSNTGEFQTGAHTNLMSSVPLDRVSQNRIYNVGAAKYTNDWHVAGASSPVGQTDGHRHGLKHHTHNGLEWSNHAHMIGLVPHHHRVHDHQHELTIPSHAHSITIPAHKHPIEHGIYKGTKASSYDLYVDELKIGTYKENVENLDLIPFLKKDVNSNGKILRGNHLIKIVPNQMTRVEAWLQIRLFTQSRGSGQF